jgi:hypothetical protein
MAARYRTYTIQFRDRLDIIAADFGVAIEQLIRVNPQLEDYRFNPILPVGNELIIPEPSDTASTQYTLPPWRTRTP